MSVRKENIPAYLFIVNFEHISHLFLAFVNAVNENAGSVHAGSVNYNIVSLSNMAGKIEPFLKEN